MPSLGADMTEGTLVQWNVKCGDIIAIVGTEKADIKLEVYETGTIKTLMAKPGNKLLVGTPLALIRAEGETPSPVFRTLAANPRAM